MGLSADGIDYVSGDTNVIDVYASASACFEKRTRVYTDGNRVVVVREYRGQESDNGLPRGVWADWTTAVEWCVDYLRAERIQ